MKICSLFNCINFILIGLLLISTACTQTNFSASSINSYLNVANTTFSNVAKVIAADGQNQDFFGNAIAVDGNIIVVGASGNDSNKIGAGAAYIFERKLSKWQLSKKLIVSDGAANDHFGVSVAVNGDTVVVGANGSNVKGTDSGAIYVFNRNEGGIDNWGQVAKLSANDGDINEFFGYAVAIGDSTLAVGAPLDSDKGLLSGSVYIFENLQGNWQQAQKLNAADASVADSFGISLAISQNVLTVGAWGDDDNGDNSGSAYVFENQQGIWQQVKKLLASDGKANDSFGYSVDIYKDTVVVGSWGNDNQNGEDSGSVYIFERESNWGQVGKLTVETGTAAAFGVSVAISGNKLVVGASGDDANGSYSGSAYVFARPKGASKNWQQIKKISAKDGSYRDFFSDPVAISGSTIIAGASVDDDRGQDSGSIYVYELSNAY